eukprot:1143562-Rhodomonas_salina.1
MASLIFFGAWERDIRMSVLALVRKRRKNALAYEKYPLRSKHLYGKTRIVARKQYEEHPQYGTSLGRTSDPHRTGTTRTCIFWSSRRNQARLPYALYRDRREMRLIWAGVD